MTSLLKGYTRINPISNTSEDLVKNELLIGGGLVVFGGLVGFTYTYIKNQNKTTGDVKTSDFRSAFEGALVGAVIALVTILIYRSIFHYKSVAKIYADSPLASANVASANVARKVAVAGSLGSRPALNSTGLGVIPNASLVAKGPLKKN